MAARLRATPSEQSFAAVGADIVCDVVPAVPTAVVTFATGESARARTDTLPSTSRRPTQNRALTCST